MSQHAEPAEAAEVVDLRGCDACALGCAVACADGDDDRPREARRVLVGSGLAVVILSVGPGLVARHAVVAVLGLTSAVLGLMVALLSGLALRGRGPGGDRYARLAFRLLPFAVACMVTTGVGAVLTRLL
jgi:hypothetical protein